MGESAVQLGVALATSDPVVGDANINNQITLSRRICKVVDDFEVPFYIYFICPLRPSICGICEGVETH